MRAVRQARGGAGAAGRPPRGGPAVLAGGHAHPGGPVTGGIGTRMAFEPGRGRTAVPVRSALAGTAIAVAAVVAAAVFGTSLVGLVSSPQQYGQNWDQQLNLGFAAVPCLLRRAIRRRHSGRHRVRARRHRPAQHRRDAGAVVGVDPVHGDGYLTMLAGRPPANASEIALGAQSMRALGVRIGQTVRVRVDWATGELGPATQYVLRVTGTVVLPDFGQAGLSSDTDLGNGAVVSPALLSMRPHRYPRLHDGRATCYSLLLFRYRPGTDLAAAPDSAARRRRQGRVPVRRMHGDRRPAARRHQELRRHQGHPARARRGARRARRRHPRPRAAHRGTTPTARPGGAQDPRVHPAGRCCARSPGRPARWPPPRWSSGSRSA